MLVQKLRERFQHIAALMKRQSAKVGTAYAARVREHRCEVEPIARDARHRITANRAGQYAAIAVAVDPPALNEITEFHRSLSCGALPAGGCLLDTFCVLN